MIAMPQRGEIRWAAVPFAFEAPFRGPEWDGELGFADAVERVQAARDGALEALVPLRIRPVLVLHGWDACAHGSYAVLRTKRLELLDDNDRALARSGDDPGLVPLDGVYAGSERAVMVRSIARVHASAIDVEVLGVISPAELQAVGEGVANALQLDLDGIVRQRVDGALAGLGLA